MARRASEPIAIPSWIVVWCLTIAAIWFTPGALVDRFVVGPGVDGFMNQVVSERNVSERHVESMHVMFVQQLRIMASAFAVLYLVVRVLTSRWRRQEVDS